jgi:hypothetical protein
VTKRSSWPVRALDAVIGFLLGEDWTLGVGVLLLLCLTGLVSKLTSSWWVLLLGLPMVLALSLARATRPKGDQHQG